MRRRITKKGRAAQAALSLSLSKRQVGALLQLVDYTFREEEQHFYAEQPQDRSRHIFNAIRIVALAVGYTSKAHLRILDQQDAAYWSSTER